MIAAIDSRMARLIVIGAALLYGAAHLAWYGTTPLGGFPVLDGREILELAKAIAAGTLPAEPFYRAPLYPAVIALFIKLGIPETFLPDAARLLNLLAHVASATLVFELSRRIFADLRAGVLGGVLYALYPVALHFAGDPLDITLATTLALAATLAAWIARERASMPGAALAAALLALAALARPNFLLCLPALLLWFGLVAWRDRQALRLMIAAALGAALVLGSMGIVNQIVGKQFRLLPWQGSHAIWDANGPGVTGLFYQHTISIPDLVPGTNPARAEAEILYCRDRPCADGIDIDDFQAYWRGRWVDHVVAHPGEWLQLMASKSWYLVNNYEQYNNKTYWFHKDRAPWLRWNPLCWAVILALAAGAAWLPMRPGARQLFLLLAGAYACGLLLYFVSARFRVPMAGWLCVLAGGWALSALRRQHQFTWDRRRLLPALATALAVGAVALWPVPEQLRQGTVAEDWMLMASANLSAGRWQESEDWASRALERDPQDPVAHALVCSARLYAWENSPGEQLPPTAWMQDSLAHCTAGTAGGDRAAYNAGFFLAGLCQHEQVIAVWRKLTGSRVMGELARSALAVLGEDNSGGAAANVGLLEFSRKPESEQLRGQRSMLQAVLGRHCPAAAETPVPADLMQR